MSNVALSAREIPAENAQGDNGANKARLTRPHGPLPVSTCGEAPPPLAASHTRSLVQLGVIEGEPISVASTVQLGSGVMAMHQ